LFTDTRQAIFQERRIQNALLAAQSLPCMSKQLLGATNNWEAQQGLPAWVPAASCQHTPECR
jgi:hypothetical protein